MTQPLRVMIDARMLIGRFAGIARFVTQLVEHLATESALSEANIRVVPLCAGEIFDDWRDRDDIEPVTCNFSRSDRSAYRRLRWEARHLNDCIRRAHIDVFHATWNTGIAARCSVPTILTIHDLIGWAGSADRTEPASQFTSRIQHWSYRHNLRASARRATSVTTVSEYVRRQVIDTLGIAEDRVTTIYNGVNPVVQPASSTAGQRDHDPSQPPYVLYVGGFEARKNIAGLLRMMQSDLLTLDQPLKLRLTGNSHSLTGEAARVYDNLPDKSHIRFLGTISDEQLASHYARAAALVTLSHDEGFGLPVLEAMAHGCPVVASNRSCLPEIVQDAGLLVDPDDPWAAAGAIRMLLTDRDKRAALVRKGLARARDFTWSRAADSYSELYGHVAHRTGHAPKHVSQDARNPAFSTVPIQ